MKFEMVARMGRNGRTARLDFLRKSDEIWPVELRVSYDSESVPILGRKRDREREREVSENRVDGGSGEREREREKGGGRTSA